MKLEVSGSRQIGSWMREQRVSLALTTYQSGKIFLIGAAGDGKLTVFNRNFQRVMGLCCPRPGTIWMSTLYQIWRLENSLAPGQMHGIYDQLYVPQVSFITGDVDAHDIALETGGTPIFVNTLFSCLARP
ncbi:MAG: DUF4915 domain-containing protein, partial [Verrucomicrobiales bacterium]